MSISTSLYKLLNIFFSTSNLKSSISETGLYFGDESNFINDSELRRHTLIEGQNIKDRKSLMIDLIKQRSAQGNGWIYVDFSEEDSTAELDAIMAQNGRLEDLKCVSYFSSEASANAYSYNPLLFGEVKSIAASIVDLVLFNPSSPSADFYKFRAREYLEVVIGALVHLNIRYSIKELCCICMSTDSLSNLYYQITDISLKNRFDEVIIQQYSLDNSCETLINSKIASHLGEVFGRLNSLLHYLELIPDIDSSAPDLNLSIEILNNKCVYIRVPANLASSLGRLIINDVYQAANISAISRFEASKNKGFSSTQPKIYSAFISDVIEAITPNISVQAARSRSMGLSLIMGISAVDLLCENIRAIYANSATKILVESDATYQIKTRVVP